MSIGNGGLLTLNTSEVEIQFNLNSTDFVTFDTMERHYLQDGLLVSLYLFHDEMNGLILEFLDLRLLVLIIFCVVIVGSYLFVYSPMLLSIQEDTLRTRALLFVVPPTVLTSNHKIREYVTRLNK